MSSETLAVLCESLDGPMAIVTAFDGRERSGCLVGFHTQCSIAPQRWLVCISKANHTYAIALGAERLALHFLRNDQYALAELFGSVTDDVAPEEKFARCEWHADSFGTPVLAGCDYITGRVLERIDTGDHVAHVIEIEAAVRGHVAAAQLGFAEVRGMHPGHAPGDKRSPSFGATAGTVPNGNVPGSPGYSGSTTTKTTTLKTMKKHVKSTNHNNPNSVVPGSDSYSGSAPKPAST